MTSRPYRSRRSAGSPASVGNISALLSIRDHGDNQMARATVRHSMAQTQAQTSRAEFARWACASRSEAELAGAGTPREARGSDPRLPRLTSGTGGLIAHVGSDPVHQERHCLRLGRSKAIAADVSQQEAETRKPRVRPGLGWMSSQDLLLGWEAPCSTSRSGYPSIV
jgi:hypothetical protein